MVRPNVRRVAGHKDWHIAAQPNRLAGGILLDIGPLTEKKELAKLVQLNLIAQFAPGSIESFGFAQDQVGWPLQPTRAAVGNLEGHEQCIIVQPTGLVDLKAIKRGPEMAGRALAEILPRLCQHAEFELDHPSVVDYALFMALK